MNSGKSLEYYSQYRTMSVPVTDLWLRYAISPARFYGGFTVATAPHHE